MICQLMNDNETLKEMVQNVENQLNYGLQNEIMRCKRRRRRMLDILVLIGALMGGCNIACREVYFLRIFLIIYIWQLFVHLNRISQPF